MSTVAAAELYSVVDNAQKIDAALTAQVLKPHMPFRPSVCAEMILVSTLIHRSFLSVRGCCEAIIVIVAVLNDWLTSFIFYQSRNNQRECD
jgi:hypothetical protein